ncbi:hypothetical protein LO749_20375 [Paracoccus denitrificans]|uniref:hypothetical protein n=1 Tax=Paracoccus denitrificans TaxID=266 RepID=UPI001E540589|nr:hypothetical protein [Paracoccus denitrificans]UFS66855.1 hypothetical protein LO749_20375 [Paracoccus denitrificans]
MIPVKQKIFVYDRFCRNRILKSDAVADSFGKRVSAAQEGQKTARIPQGCGGGGIAMAPKFEHKRTLAKVIRGWNHGLAKPAGSPGPSANSALHRNGGPFRRRTAVSGPVGLGLAAKIWQRTPIVE